MTLTGPACVSRLAKLSPHQTIESRGLNRPKSGCFSRKRDCLNCRSRANLGSCRWTECPKLIAIIDDDEAMQDSLRDLMEAAGLVARCFGSAEEFLESDLHRKAACLIVDVRMPKMSGLQLQAKLKEEESNVPIIFITAHGDARMRIQAMREAAVEFLSKPFDHQLLLKRVRAAFDM